MSKVLYIGFGITPYARGGAITYQESLMKEANAHGWEVTCFYVTLRNTISFRKEPYLKSWYRGKIKFIELYNSPHVYGRLNNPDEQCHHPAIENLMQKVVDEEKPNIVHIQELQMHTASVIDIVFNQKIPSLKTMHNYYDVCSQRDLMYKAKELCLDFDEGRRCVECLTIQPSACISFKRKIARALLPDFTFNILSKFYIRIKKFLGYKKEKEKLQNNKVTIYTAEQYRRRRIYFIERLNKLDVVHFSTHRFAEIFIHCGLLKDKVKIIALSTKSIEEITPKPLRGNQYPVVFGFLGGTWTHKGYQVLIDAFSKFDQNKAKLIIYGVEKSTDLNQDLNIELRKPFRYGRLNRLFQEIDVGIVPSIWEETFGIVGIEFLTARIPVIASNIGGIPEWLKDGENGFLVEPDNADDLAKKMQLFVNKPELISEIQRKIKPWKSFDMHADEIIALYDNLIFGRKK